MASLSFADRALEAFPPLLVELVRADAAQTALLAEGFKYREIGAVRALLSQSDRKPLDADAGHTASSSATATATRLGDTATGEAVTLERERT